MSSFGPTVLRLATGVVFVAHGAQKVFGIGGAGGLSATAASFEQLGLTPAFVLAMAVGVAESVGGVLLLAGLFTRIVAGVLAAEMLVAVWKVHAANGFFLNWTNASGAGHGYEFHLLLVAALASIILMGPGALSIDHSKAHEAASDAADRGSLRSGAV